jgi:hypothetical protein
MELGGGGGERMGKEKGGRGGSNFEFHLSAKSVM